MRILVADDESLVRRFLKTVLEGEWHDVTVVEASNGREALEKAVAASPDLIIIDIRMPVMSGLEAVRQIRLRYEDVPVLFLTAYEEFDYAVEAIKLKAADYLVKPVRPDFLIKSVSESLRRQGASKNERLGFDSIDPLMSALAKCVYEGDTYTLAETAGVSIPLERVPSLEGMKLSQIVETYKLMKDAAIRTLVSAAVDAGVARLFAELVSVNSYAYSRQSLAGTAALLAFAVYRLKTDEPFRVSQAAARLVEERCAGSVSLDDLSSSFHLSPFYMSRMFRREIGINFSRYLTLSRIDVACRVLADTDARLDEVAAIAGFSSARYLSIAFKSIVGTSPTDYRRTLSHV